MAEIDCIIPAYNADKLHKALASVAMQTVSDDVLVTVVDDHSDISCGDVVADFGRHVRIQLQRLDRNSGPGAARQHGMEHGSAPYITFVDADDTLSDCFALQNLFSAMRKDAGAVAVYGRFLEETDAGTLVEHTNDTVWCFGNMYRRSFIERHNIHFTATRANEDAGFNMQVKLCSSDAEHLRRIRQTTYIWHNTTGSITRANNKDYNFNASFIGYVDNMIHAIRHAEANGGSAEFIRTNKINILMRLYRFCIECSAMAPKYLGQCVRKSAEYMDAIYNPIAGTVSAEELRAHYALVARNAAISGNDCIPYCTFAEWMRSTGGNA